MRWSYRAVLVSFVSLAVAACGDSTAIPAAAATSSVRLLNDSPGTITNVRLTVAPNIDIVESSIAPGALSPEHLVSAVYENPAVSLVANGKELSAIPVEGFSGFNKLLGMGAFVISIGVDGTPPQLRITVTQLVEGRSKP